MNKSLPPYPHGADDLRLHPVLTLGDSDITPDAWMIASSFAVMGGTGDPATVAPDTLELPVVNDGVLFKTVLGDLLADDVDARDVGDVLRATLAAAASCALQMRRYTSAAERLLAAPAVTPTGVAR